MARILIIDDSMLARHTHSNILLEMGHDVAIACDGLEGFNLVSRERFDVVLVDMMMPQMDGIGFLRALKEGKINVPVIVLSADIQETKRAECFALGALAFVEKPAKKAKLADLLAGILEGARG